MLTRLPANSHFHAVTFFAAICKGGLMHSGVVVASAACGLACIFLMWVADGSREVAHE